MESALDVLSRAATMVQDNANESRLISKELPTSAWRRERRLRTGEYHHPNHYPSSTIPLSGVPAASPNSSPPPSAHAHQTSISSGNVTNASAHQISMMMAAAASIRPLFEPAKQPASTSNSNLAKQIHLDPLSHTPCLQQTNSPQNDDAPLDMSVGSLKQRSSPPPPYREPLPNSQYASSLARPSVITQAPPKRDTKDSTSAANRESDNRSCESIDEHFRRSLGNDYFSLFTKNCSASHSTATLSPQTSNQTPLKAHIRSSSPTLPTSSVASILPHHSELSSPPAYPVNLPSANSQYVYQNQLITSSKPKNMLISPPILASQTTVPSSPPLPLVVRSNVMQNQHHARVSQKSSSFQTKTPLTSPQSPVHSTSIKLGNTTSSTRPVSPITLQQHPLNVTSSLSHLSSLDNSPSSSPCRTPPVHNTLASTPSSNLPAIMRIKTEPGLQNINSRKPSPPASPTSTTRHASNSDTSVCSAHTSSPSSPKSNWKSSSNAGNTNTEVLASVDDHFAKALGDTWKKLQENKEMRK